MSVTLRKRALLLLILSLSILNSCSREATHTVSGKVIKVADGDTITILDEQNFQHKIRLQGIDAPERKQDFGQVSRQNLASLVFGKYVKIDYEKTDRYGRLVGKVWVEGNDECLEQVKAGLAWHYKEYEKEQTPADRQLYANAEQEAHAQKRGLWKDPNPTPPWDFRHHASGSTEESDGPDEPSLDDPGSQSARPSAEPNVTSASTADRNSTNARKPFADFNTAAGELGLIRGNKRSNIYHWPGCPDYDKIAPHNRVPFRTPKDAEIAGYRAARNCP